MTQVTIPFHGRPYRFDVPDRNLAEVLSPRPAASVDNLEAEIERALSRPIRWGKMNSGSGARGGDSRRRASLRDLSIFTAGSPNPQTRGPSYGPGPIKGSGQKISITWEDNFRFVSEICTLIG